MGGYRLKVVKRYELPVIKLIKPWDCNVHMVSIVRTLFCVSEEKKRYII